MTSPRVALYGNGLFNQTDPSPPYAEQITQLTTGGFTTAILWSIHVHTNGDFYYNDTLMVSGGVIQLGSDFAENVNALAAGGVHVPRPIERTGDWSRTPTVFSRTLSKTTTVS